MELLTKWKWGRKIIPEEEIRKKRNIAKVTSVGCLNWCPEFATHCKEKTLLITGDGSCLPDDVKEFESWNIPHDVLCCNRSLLYFQRPVNHWAAIDCEESVWLSEYAKGDNGHFLRHVIGSCAIGYDVFWYAADGVETEYGRRQWVGNTGYFGMLIALNMGYEKVILAGMPLDRNRHWYEPEGTEGPHWVSDTYTIWMDWKMERPEAGQVRSLSGYSAFILGKATKEWVLNE